MASHHHPYHHCHPTTTTSTTCYCCYCYTPPHNPPVPDPHLHSIPSTHLHHPAPPPQPHIYAPYQNPPYVPQTQYHPPQAFHQEPFHHRQHQQEQEEQTQPLVSSLLRRIAALESSLLRHSATTHSLRDAAARTIQTHFRAFLVRRSRTLRQLKDLASIKSVLITLKSVVSDNVCFDPQALSHQAMDLLIRLDSIQGGDPMIRDGKRAISGELQRLLELIDGACLKRSHLPRRVVKNVRYVSGTSNSSSVLGGDQEMVNDESLSLGSEKRELMNDLRGRIEKLSAKVVEGEEEEEEGGEPENLSNVSLSGKYGVSQKRDGVLLRRNGGAQAKTKKSVTFVENGDVYRVVRSNHGPVSDRKYNIIDQNDSFDAVGELIDNLHGEVEEIGMSSKEAEDDEEAHSEDAGGSARSSDCERDSRNSPGSAGRNRQYQSEDGSFVFSAPLPVKMETRAGLMNKRKTITIIK